MQWLTRQGPFWEDVRHHDSDDWLEYHGNIVTDTAVGEVAWCCLNGIERGLVSLEPSDWNFSPVIVELLSDKGSRREISVANYWSGAALEAFLRTAPVQITSWDQLKAVVIAQCTELVFAADAFEPLAGHPFVHGAAVRVVVLLSTLNHFRSCFDEQGKRTAEGHEIYRNFFTGKKGDGGRGAVFSDSSEDEKSKFKAELTFRDPSDPKKTIFCPMHGKIQTPQLRVHFSWPVCHDEALYIVYVGPKITKR